MCASPSEYEEAAICRRGHEVERAIHGEVAPRCEQCGAKVLDACPHCQEPIRGILSGSAMAITRYDPPDFCWSCGEAFPWASRQAVVYKVQNLLDEQPDLSEGDRRRLEEELKALLETPSEVAVDKRQQRALEAVRTLAPKVWERAGPIASVLLTAEAKRKLGLPP